MIPVDLVVGMPIHDSCQAPAWRDTLPAGYDRCGPCPDPTPLNGLVELAVVGWPIDGQSADTLARVDVSGREGETVRVTVQLDNRPWSLWAIVRKARSDWSCMGQGLAWGDWPVHVPPDVRSATSSAHFYDVAGRRLARPPPSGVYFVRIAGETRKRIVMH